MEAMVKAKQPAPGEKRGSRRTRTGIALSATEIRAAGASVRGSPVASAGGWRAALEPPDPATGSWPSLTAALTELAASLHVDGGSLVVSLLPPLTEVRRLELPPLRDEELHRLLARNAQRYFLNARDPQIVGASSFKRRRGEGPAAVVGAAASARLVAAIESAARAAGWSIDAIVPAEAGWRSAALSLWPALNKGIAHVLVHLTDRIDVLRIEDGELAGVRRFRGGAADADLIADLISQSRNNGTLPRVAAIGTPAPRKELTRALSTHGTIVVEPPGEWTTSADDAALIAASFAEPDEQLALRTEAALAQRAQRYRFATYYVAAAAVGLFALAGWLELKGVQRQLAEVQAERERIRPQLQLTISGQRSFETTHAKLAELLEAECSAPHWGMMIASITDHLDADAYLDAFRTRGDTVTIQGRADGAAPVIEALVMMPGLANARSAGQVQRDVQRSGEALDRFVVAGQRIPPACGAPASAAPRRSAIPGRGVTR